MEGEYFTHRQMLHHTNQTLLGTDTTTTTTTASGKKEEKPKTTDKPVETAELANEAAETGNCPDTAVHKKPDKFGNCECKPDLHCYEERIAAQGLELSKEVASSETQKKMKTLFEEEAKTRGPGC